MKVRKVKVRKRIKYENIALLFILGSVIFGGYSIYYTYQGNDEFSTKLAVYCLINMLTAFVMNAYGEYQRKRRIIVIKLEKDENSEKRVA